jgi:hypothetical protein
MGAIGNGDRYICVRNFKAESVLMHYNVNTSTYLLKPHMKLYKSTFHNWHKPLLYMIKLIGIQLIKRTNITWCCLMVNRMADKHIYIVPLGINNICMR